ncbi:hypothetical protein Cpir12675_005973 [Ceratocystis pirilliformis]|uniref:HTH CENPB-type domain-containing protein n=1 Tax=Ceratocystis pirilliformis TaxID=259994 RepID=A0ABR3YKT8_9PEZI
MTSNCPYPTTPSWVNMGNSYPASGLSEYGAYPYVGPAHGLPLSSESLSRSIPPPTLPPLSLHHSSSQQNHSPSHHSHNSQEHPHHHQVSHHTSAPLPSPASESAAHQPSQTLPNLVMPNHSPWPSMLTGSMNTSPYSASPMLMAQPDKARQARSRQAKSSGRGPRKMLSNEDKHRMWLFHQKNPGKKQTEIGDMFGVERSTVSKVLCKKKRDLKLPDQKMSRGQQSSQSRPQLPDIEGVLGTWAQDMISQGSAPTDQDLLDHANRLLSTTQRGAGNKKAVPRLDHHWLKNFKQRYGLASSPIVPSPQQRLPDIGSVGGETQRMSISHLADPAMTSSSSSPTNTSVPTHLSSSQDHQQRDIHGREAYPGSYYDIGVSIGVGYPKTVSSSQGSMTSEAEFSFSPHSDGGALMPSTDSRFQRPRSQTYPVVPGIDYGEAPSGPDSHGQPVGPKYHGSVEGSPSRSHGAVNYPIDPQVRRIASNNSMYSTPPISSQQQNNAQAGSPLHGASSTEVPGTPTAEDARKALETALSYAQKSSANTHDLLMVVRFFHDLGIHMDQEFEQLALTSLKQLSGNEVMMTSQ